MVPWLCDGSGRGVVSVDWFGASCLLGEPRGDRELVAPSGCSVVKMSPTAVWSDRFFILDGDGNKVATYLGAPRTPRMDGRRALIEVANRYLYMDCFESVCGGLFEMLPMAVTGLNRVDLCCDFEMSPSLWRTFCALAEGRAYVKAMREGVVWWKMLSTGGDDSKLLRVPHCISWGGKESLIRWKIYYKWLELAEAPPESKKPYIEDLWRSMGFNARAVWRIEVSIHGTNKLADAGGARVAPMLWYRDAVKLFSGLYADKFQVRKAEGHKDKRNDTVLPFLGVDGSKLLWHALPRIYRDESDPAARVACRLWKELQQYDVQANDLLLWTVKNALEEMCENAATVRCICKTFGVSVDDIHNALQP